MSPLGRFRPLVIVTLDWQLSSSKETLGKNFPQPKSDRPLMRMKQSVNTENGGRKIPL